MKACRLRHATAIQVRAVGTPKVHQPKLGLALCLNDRMSSGDLPIREHQHVLGSPANSNRAL